MRFCEGGVTQFTGFENCELREKNISKDPRIGYLT